ncbi:uncharacterized protein LOC126781849 [Nymphalis io]|uniref:uncharacterized protein LOC126781849 n=1 Tax=Inachis io TaxID=171585 RepID=UPI0021670EAF|nr:uncharacterized protein LOC126781849 [Nymphalis io]XP_050362915.1 uncharacterized protein LOC126781849 [Nymphalis io]
MVVCYTCNNNLLVTQKRVKCSNTSCNRHFHADCIKFNEAQSSRAKWVCPICQGPKSKTGNKSSPSDHGKSIKESEIDSPVSLVSNIDSQDAILQEIRNLRREMNEKFEYQQLSLNDFNTKLSEIRGEVRDLNSKFSIMRKELDQVTNTVQFLSDNFDEQQLINDRYKTDISQLKTESTSLRAQLSKVASLMEQLEQRARDCNIEIQCVPEHKSENLLTIVKQLTKVVSCVIDDSDIKEFHRVAKVDSDSKRSRNIIVKLTSPRVRDTILAAVKIFNKKNENNKLNSTHLGIAGDKQSIYVSEHLSPTNKKLHAATRLVAKEKKYEFVWIRNSRIYIRKNMHSPAILIRNNDFLNSLK